MGDITKRKTLEPEKHPREDARKNPRAKSRRRIKHRKTKIAKLEMTPTHIKNIESPAQSIMSGFPLCNHPLWKPTVRGEQPTPCIPSPLEQLRRQNTSGNETKINPDTKSNLRPGVSPWNLDEQIIHCRESTDPDDKIKLGRYFKWKEYSEANAKSEPPGLEWRVCQRIDTLNTMQQHLEEYDPYLQLPNVQAILEA
ncbi:hypothetical protein N7492_009600 [Penicillium capsulatum]|uniref:Uncharacterized protein n=1 Tax=Penicillium capsulatum TaxID=69766 RepID=A0A9W9HT18_9EURO|nr:hypothetical protein N7492_009600 [Penicillium capsulatum]KAJ6106988.1 hypothetical protein N7512_010505 [Penicillium capsulatum]